MVWQRSGIRGPITMPWAVLIVVVPFLAATTLAVAKYVGLSKFHMLWVVVLVGLLPVLAKLANEAAHRKLEHRRQIKKIAPTSKRGRLPKARDIEISRSHRLHAAERREVPYVPRDADPQIEDQLKRSQRVLVVGTSMVGKTRSLLESMARIYPSYSVWIPGGPEQLKTVVNDGLEVRKTAILLDDLERFAADGITDILEGLAASNVILASIRSIEYERLQPYGEIKPIGWDLCAWLGEPVWLLAWSDAEIDRARQYIPEKHHDALSRDGLSAFVGGGRLLESRISTLRATNGPTFAAVQFARDWRSFSASAGFTLDAFEAMTEYYPHSGAYDRETLVADLLNPVFSDVALIEVIDDLLVFSDYIDEIVDPITESRSAAYWERVIELGDDRDRVNIGAFLMRTATTVDLAISAFTKSNESLAAVNLAGIYTHFEPADLDRAEVLLRPHAATMPEAAFTLGVVLEKRLGGEDGLNPESRELYEFAATKEFEGLPSAQFNVANYILQDAEPDLGRAESLLRSAMDSGHGRSAARLGELLINAGRTQEGMDVLAPIAEENIDGSAFVYSSELAETEPEKAELFARSHCTEIELAGVLIDLGGSARAREALDILANLDQDGSDSEPAAWLKIRALLEAGECTATDANEAVHLNWDRAARLEHLGYRFLDGQFEPPGLKALQRSFELGNVRAAFVLGEYYRDVYLDFETAEIWYRRALDDRYPTSLVAYANFLYDREDFDGARDLWTRALSLSSDSPDEQNLVESVAVGNLGYLLMENGELDEAEALFRKSIKGGRPRAMSNLSSLLRLRGGPLNRLKSAYWKWRARRAHLDPDMQSQTFSTDPAIQLFSNDVQFVVIDEEGMTIFPAHPSLESDG